jgi:hypothetical protein
MVPHGEKDAVVDELGGILHPALCLQHSLEESGLIHSHGLERIVTVEQNVTAGVAKQNEESFQEFRSVGRILGIGRRLIELLE